MDYNFVIQMEDDFTIERKARTPDGVGGFSYSYVPIDTIKGRLDDEKYNETIRIGQDTVYITHRFFTFPSTDLRREDKVTGKGAVLRVIYTRTEYEDHPMEVLCQEIDP